MTHHMTDPQVSLLIQEFSSIMPEQLLTTLPQRREIEHTIKLLPKKQPSTRAPYKMTLAQLVEEKKQLEELLRVRHIHSSQAPFDVLIIFQQKKNISLWLYVD